MNIANFDLNLLRVFAVLLKERSVTAAGTRLGLSQSSVSHALRRLREHCDDALFVRTKAGMQPTALAIALAEPIVRALELIDGGLAGSARFDPATARRTFTLLLSDVGQLSYVPRLAEHLTRVAPGIELAVSHLPLDSYREALQSGGAHLAIGHLPGLVSGFHRSPLFDDRYVCLLRADHPTIRGRLTRKAYLAATHVVVEPPGRGPGLVDAALQHLQRRIAVRLPHFIAVPAVLRRGNHVTTAPSYVTRAFGDLENIRWLPLPFDVPPLHVAQYWHERVHRDPGHRWLRGVITAMFAQRGGRAARSASSG
jgi:DNA-binding transcriptional LysR family regulator